MKSGVTTQGAVEVIHKKNMRDVSFLFLMSFQRKDEKWVDIHWRLMQFCLLSALKKLSKTQGHEYIHRDKLLRG